MKPEIEKERDKELEILIKELQKADDTVYAVLISHLYIDHLLDRYLIASTTNDVGLTGKDGLSFHNKLKLATAVTDINPQLVDSLKKLNSIRNGCAHQFGHKISQKNIDGLGRTLGKDYSRILEEYPGGTSITIVPISLNLCGQMLHATLWQEGYR